MAPTDRLVALLLVFCFLVVFCWSADIEEVEGEDFYEETVVLKTKLGSIRGHKEVVNFNTSYYAFKGIRYAKAPKRERRFQVNCSNLSNIILVT